MSHRAAASQFPSGSLQIHPLSLDFLIGPTTSFTRSTQSCNRGPELLPLDSSSSTSCPTAAAPRAPPPATVPRRSSSTSRTAVALSFLFPSVYPLLHLTSPSLVLQDEQSLAMATGWSSTAMGASATRPRLCLDFAVLLPCPEPRLQPAPDPQVASTRVALAFSLLPPPDLLL